ncbi:hypothetical protein Tco_0128612 [Tanacetum coccineum]
MLRCDRREPILECWETRSTTSPRKKKELGNSDSRVYLGNGKEYIDCVERKFMCRDTVVVSSVRDEHVLSSLGAHMVDSWINKGTQEGNEGQTPVSSNVDLIIISESHTSYPKYSGPSGNNVSHDTTLKAAATMPTNEVPSPKSFVGLVNNEAKIGLNEERVMLFLNLEDVWRVLHSDEEK